MHLRSSFCVLVSVTLASATLIAQQANNQSSQAPLITQTVNEALRTQLTHNVHPLARLEYDRGEAPADLPLERMLLVLKRSPQQEATLEQLIQNQQNAQSPEYHRWLTPEQVGERFGPAPSDVAAVTQWLASRRLQVSRTSKSGLFIEFSGSAADVGQAFGTSIHNYVVNGQQHWANASDPTIPVALAPVVAGVNSLHNFQKQAQNVPLGAYSASSHRLASPQPMFNVGGNPTEYAVSPYDFAAIYDLFPLWNAAPTPINGKGQTIAIVGRSDVNPADATAMWSYFGLDGTHAPEPKLVVTYNGPNPGKTDDEAEADIDTQWSGAVAPGATINLVVSASTTSTDGVDLSALYIVDNNLATVMSESYGACEKSMGSSGVQFYGSLWEQAAAQGISVFISSGDSGAAGCDDPSRPARSGLQVNGIAATPYNAAVGGTDFSQYNNWSAYWSSTNNSITKQSALGYIPETTWNDSCTNGVVLLLGGNVNTETNCNSSSFSSLLDSIGGGGGFSTAWLKPVWQTGTLSDNARDLPDISLFSGNGFFNSYYLVCQSDAQAGSCQYGVLQGFGGTSISSPQFAAIMALINQKTGSAQGIPGHTLYKLAAQQPSAFHDIPAGSTIAMPCFTGTPNCTTSSTGDTYGVLFGYNTAAGYDLATGLGSIDAAKLVNQWQSVSFSPSTTMLSVNGGSTVNIMHGASVPFSATVSPSGATGEIALMEAPGIPGDPGIAAFALNSGSVNSTAFLPGGSYSLLAHYSGDSTYGGSYSNTVPVVVSPEPSKAMVNLVTTDVNGVPISYSASNATYGSGYWILRVDVGDANASISPASGISSLCASHKESCPTGSVTLKAAGTPLDNVAISLNNQGYAEVAAPPPAVYSMTAVYPGDASFSASTGAGNFTIAKAPTTVSANVVGPPIQFGSGNQITANLSTMSNGVAPTGTFQYYLDGNPFLGPQGIYGSGAYSGIINGIARYAYATTYSSVAFTALGNHTLTVKYSGDANYATSTSAATNFTVTQAKPAIYLTGFGSPAQNVVVGQAATASVSVYGSNGFPPTGTVTFYDGGTAIAGTVTYSSSTAYGILNATITATFSTVGTRTITASYSGDANYLAAPNSASQILSVLGPINLTPSGPMIISSPGQSGSVTLTITPNGGFAGSLSLACAADPKASESGCSLTSGSTSGSALQINVAGQTTVTLNVTTTASHPIAKLDAAPFGAAATVAMAGALALLLPVRKRYRNLGLCGIAIVMVLGLGACGGGSSGSTGGSGGNGGSNSNIDPGTPLGTYTFNIAATTGSGTSQVVLNTPLSVTVN